MSEELIKTMNEDEDNLVWYVKKHAMPYDDWEDNLIKSCSPEVIDNVLRRLLESDGCADHVVYLLKQSRNTNDKVVHLFDLYNKEVETPFKVWNLFSIIDRHYDVFKKVWEDNSSEEDDLRLIIVGYFPSQHIVKTTRNVVKLHYRLPKSDNYHLYSFQSLRKRTRELLFETPTIVEEIHPSHYPNIIDCILPPQPYEVDGFSQTVIKIVKMSPKLRGNDLLLRADGIEMMEMGEGALFVCRWKYFAKRWDDFKCIFDQLTPYYLSLYSQCYDDLSGDQEWKMFRDLTKSLELTNPQRGSETWDQIHKRIELEKRYSYHPLLPSVRHGPFEFWNEFNHYYKGQYDNGLRVGRWEVGRGSTYTYFYHNDVYQSYENEPVTPKKIAKRWIELWFGEKESTREEFIQRWMSQWMFYMVCRCLVGSGDKRNMKAFYALRDEFNENVFEIGGWDFAHNFFNSKYSSIGDTETIFLSLIQIDETTDHISMPIVFTHIIKHYLKKDPPNEILNWVLEKDYSSHLRDEKLTQRFEELKQLKTTLKKKTEIQKQIHHLEKQLHTLKEKVKILN